MLPSASYTMVQITSYFDGLAQAGMIPMIPSTSQTLGGSQIPAIHTSEQSTAMFQAPGVQVDPPVKEFHPVATVMPEIRTGITMEEQKKMDRF